MTPARHRQRDTHDPHRSRVRALRILFQADLRDLDPTAVLEQVADDEGARLLLDDLDEDAAADATGRRGQPGAPAELDGFARRLVMGVAERRGELDELLERFAESWTVDRMALVDRNILRLGTYELLHEATAAAVVIDEAIELAKELSTGESHRFVNGVLEAIRDAHEGTDPVE